MKENEDTFAWGVWLITQARRNEHSLALSVSVSLTLAHSLRLCGWLVVDSCNTRKARSIYLLIYGLGHDRHVERTIDGKTRQGGVGAL